MSVSRDFASRLVIAVTAGAAGLFLCWYSNAGFFAVFFFFSTFAALEFFRLVERGGHHPYRIIGFGLVVFFFLCAQYMPLENYNEIIVFSLAALALIKMAQSRAGSYRKQLTMLLIAVFCGVYIGGSMSFIIGLKKIHELKFEGITPYNYLFLLPFVGAWAADTGAYLAGRLLGKDKLAPSLSPKKSVEGLIGGIAASFAAVYIFGNILQLPLNVIIALGLLIPIIGTAGDLFESGIKRRFDTKDSGTFFRAHGGVLDRFDSIFFVLPFTYVVIYYFYIHPGN